MNPRQRAVVCGENLGQAVVLGTMHQSRLFVKPLCGGYRDSPRLEPKRCDKWLQNWAQPSWCNTVLVGLVTSLGTLGRCTISAASVRRVTRHLLFLKGHDLGPCNLPDVPLSNHWAPTPNADFTMPTCLSAPSTWNPGEKKRMRHAIDESYEPTRPVLFPHQCSHHLQTG